MQLAREAPEDPCCRSGNFLGEGKICVVFALAEVEKLEQLLEANDLSPLRCRLPDTIHGLLQVGLRIVGA